MSLTEAIENRLLKEVLIRTSREKSWKVLVLDDKASQIVNSCVKIVDLVRFKITLIEKLNLKREPLNLPAIYILDPCIESVRKLIDDFKRYERLYLKAFIYFTRRCDNAILELLREDSLLQHVQDMREIDLDFVSLEAQVYHLDGAKAFYDYVFSDVRNLRQQHNLTVMAERLASMCSIVGCRPIIRYQGNSQKSSIFASMVFDNLKLQYEINPDLIPHRNEKSVLLILDRSFDPITLSIHDFHLQSLVYDLLPVQNFEYLEFEENGKKKNIQLNDDFALWSSVRHDHIGEVLTKIPKLLQEFKEEFNMIREENDGDDNNNNQDAKQLGQVIKRMPQYTKEKATFATMLKISGQCKGPVLNELGKLGEAEQNIIFGCTTNGEPIKDLVRLYSNLFDQASFTDNEKFLWLLTFLISKQGVSEDTLFRLFEKTKLESRYLDMAKALHYYGVTVIDNNNLSKITKTSSYFPSERKERPISSMTYERYTPFIMDLMEAVTENQLSSSDYPILENDFGPNNPFENDVTGKYSSLGNSYQPQYHSNKALNVDDELMDNSDGKNCLWKNRNSVSTSNHFAPFKRQGGTGNSKLIVFIMGGFNFAEARCAYQLKSQLSSKHMGFSSQNQWDIYIGGSHPLDKNTFIHDLDNLCDY